MTIECEREQDVLDAVASRRWAGEARGAIELREHVARCPICADLVDVALALHDARARLDARVPAAGLVWWRAGLRARHEGSRAAARPLLVAQAAAWACAAGGAAALVGRAWPRVEWSAWLATIQPSLPIALMLGAWLVLAPIALYLAFSDE